MRITKGPPGRDGRLGSRMIGRGFLRGKVAEDANVAGFDNYELRLGDLMRGERATLGKSLLDVQRELKIKAAYIAAIEGADPSAFDTPGFIAGYVRSYARYLSMDPDWAFDTFCRESGFATAHGMSEAASALPARSREAKPVAAGLGKDIFAAGGTPFLPASPGFLANMEPRAVGSVLVLAALLSGLGYGGWMILREVQKVTFAPVEEPPTVVAEVDPLAGNAAPAEEEVAAIVMPSPEALDRLYRPEALDVPVLVPRDGPIAALDPSFVGSERLAGNPAPIVDQAPSPAAADPPTTPGVETALAGVLGVVPPADGSGVQVTTGPLPEVKLVAVREAWVRVKAADGSVLFEGLLAPGDTFDVPATVEPPTLRAGESGALYMALNGVPYGPVGEAGQVSSNVPLSAEVIAATYAVADLAGDEDLAEHWAVASAAELTPASLPAEDAAPAATPAALAD